MCRSEIDVCRCAGQSGVIYSGKLKGTGVGSGLGGAAALHPKMSGIVAHHQALDRNLVERAVLGVREDVATLGVLTGQGPSPQ